MTNGLPSRSPPIQLPGLRKLGTRPPQRPIPALVERGQRRHEHVAQIGQRGVDLVGHHQPLAAQHPGLPEERDLPDDRILDPVAVGRLVIAGIAQQHQRGDAVTVIDHALAPYLGRVGGKHRRDQRVLQQREHGGAVDPLLAQPGDRSGEVGARLGGKPLSILGEVGEHREQHEAAHEIDRRIEVEPFDPQHRRPCPLRSGVVGAMVLDRRLADRLDRREQIVATTGADHVAEQRSEVTDVVVVGDRGGVGHAGTLRRSTGRVNRRYSLRNISRSVEVTEPSWLRSIRSNRVSMPSLHSVALILPSWLRSSSISLLSRVGSSSGVR